MHRKIGKDRAYGSGDILADRQTNRHKERDTHRRVTAPAGDVITVSKQKL